MPTDTQVQPTQNNPGATAPGQGMTLTNANQNTVNSNINIPTLPQNNTNQTQPSSTISASSVQNNQQNTSNFQTAQPQGNQITNPSAFVSSLNTLIGNTAGQPTQAEQNQSTLSAQEAQAENQLGGEGQAELNEESNLGVPQDMQNIQDLTTTIAQQQGQYLQAENNALQSGETASYGQGAYGIAQRTAAIQMGTNAALLQAYQGNLTAAQTYAQHVVTLQYQPVLNQIQSLKDQLANNAPLMSAEQSDRAETLSAALDIQQQAVTQAATDKQNNYSSVMAAVQSGLLNPQQAQQALNGTPAQLFGILSAAYTGQPIPGVDPSDVANQTGTNVNGYDISGYATTSDGQTNPTAVSNINAALSTIQTKVGSVTDANSAQAAITALAPNSPITGAQVMTAATAAGVSPASIIAGLWSETQLGTDGSKGSQMGNYSNYGNTNSAMAQGNPVGYNNPQDSINAYANYLAAHPGKVAISTAPQTQSAQTPESNNTNIQSIIKSAPLPFQSDLSGINSTGDVFSTAAAGTPSANWAVAHGIKVVTPAEATSIKAIDAAASALDSLQSQFTAIAPKGLIGSLFSIFTGGLNTSLKTSVGNKINTYNSTALATAAAALSNITDISGSKVFNSASINSALPIIANGTKGSQSSETQDEGINKLNALRATLTGQLQSILPNSQGIPMTSSQTSNSAVTKSNGVDLTQFE